MSTETAATDAPLRKFMFDRSFDADMPRAVERKPVTLKPEQVDALKKESYDQGFVAGQQAGHDAQAAALNATLERVATTIDAMLANSAALQKQSEDGMRRMALAIVRKLMPELAAKNGTTEIEAMIATAMGDMVQESRLVVRVHDSLYDAINGKIGDMAMQKAYAGKVVVIADAQVAAGDARVEWADGGMVRDTQALMQTIETTVTP